MRSLVARVVATSLAAAGLLTLAPGPSYADPVCQVTDPETGVCLIYVEVPGTPGNPGDPGDDGGTGGEHTGAACAGPIPTTANRQAAAKGNLRIGLT